MTVSASHRFSNALRYRDGGHDNQRQLTPPYVLEPVRLALGGIDLDPCTEPDNPTRAERFFTQEDDGLRQPWSGAVYCNPPYGKAREPWVNMCISHAIAGAPVVLLIPSHTDTRVVQRCLETATSVVFIRGLFGWNIDLREHCGHLGFAVDLRRDEATARGWV